MNAIKRTIEELKADPAFCRGFRRGIGLILATFVLEQCLACALYPLLRR